jgi:hypothetical protein
VEKDESFCLFIQSKSFRKATDGTINNWKIKAQEKPFSK